MARPKRPKQTIPVHKIVQDTLNLALTKATKKHGLVRREQWVMMPENDPAVIESREREQHAKPFRASAREAVINWAMGFEDAPDLADIRMLIRVIDDVVVKALDVGYTLGRKHGAEAMLLKVAKPKRKYTRRGSANRATKAVPRKKRRRRASKLEAAAAS